MFHCGLSEIWATWTRMEGLKETISYCAVPGTMAMLWICKYVCVISKSSLFKNGEQHIQSCKRPQSMSSFTPGLQESEFSIGYDFRTYQPLNGRIRIEALDLILVVFFFFLRLYFMFRKRGREGERWVEKHQCVVASWASLTRDLACNPGWYPDWESNP